ncbi:MAG: hypothetical protein JSS79_15485 [Bacteroidetes bacterium]|nr:hypothetical protein [Bacteroidota bacterium]
MRKLFTLLVFISSFCSLFAQTLFVPNGFSATGIGSSTVSGQIGIGTSSPNSLLHLYSASPNGTVARFESASTNGRIYGIGSNFITGNGEFGIYDYTSSAERFRISSAGFVGIGNNNPLFALDVQGFGSRVLNPSTSANAYTTFRLQGPNYSNGLEIDFFGNNNIPTDPNWTYGGGVGSVAIVNVNPKPLTLGTNNVGRVLIDAAGFVGIGTYTPGNLLSVQGTASLGTVFQQKITTGAQTLALGANSTAAEIQSQGAVPLYINYGGNNVIMNATGGNVGIGTATTGSYRLAVAGKIAAAGEVRVFNTGTTSFPDYVFAPDYKLPTLEETEKYVQENHHLPDVPSAAEVEKDGMSLNDMNVILLKKVEELTLHLIEMKKQNEELKLRIGNLEKKGN